MNYELIKNSMRDLDEDTLKEQLNMVMLDGGSDALKAVDACREGMEEVGRLFEEGEYFVGDLIYAGEIMTDGLAIIKSALVSENGDSKCGKAIICTVKDDLHDIGKNIVKSLMEAGGLEVLDLGADVSPEDIVKAAKDNDIHIIALSGVLTLSLDSMKETVDAFTAEGMRDDVKIIIGGAPVNEDAFRKVGADAWSSSPQKTVDICRSWL